MKEIYDWVPWFRELAARIASIKETDLTELACKVVWADERNWIQDGTKEIDPFSFFYYLASKNTTNHLKPVYDSVRKVFGINRQLPEDGGNELFIFPNPDPRFNVFCRENGSSNELLWSLFRQANEDEPTIAPKDFEKALQLNGVAEVNLTQTLFLINPDYFVPVDNLTDDLSKALDLRPPSEVLREIKKAGGYKEYLNFLQKVKYAFPGCKPYEINMLLFLRRTDQIVLSDRFYHVSTQVHGHNKGDYWDNRDDNLRRHNFRENNFVYTGGPGSGKSWEEDEEGYPLTEPARGDIVLVRTGLRKGRAIGVVQKNDYAELGVNEDSRIHVLWINKEEEELSTDTRQNAFERIEPDWNTFAAFKETDAYSPTFDLINKLTGNQVKDQPETDPDMQPPESKKMKNQYPLNQILYGPPGTGKTWNTLDYALAIIEDERLDVIQKLGRKDKKTEYDKLQKSGLIDMVTFHQNYNYEDFIEGIRPVLRRLTEKDGNLDYDLSRGVFREIAERAKSKTEQRFVLIIDEINRGNIAKIFGELITLIEDSKRIGEVDAATATLPYSKDEFGVPNNLYIIGTMNTADRSIALLDTALRRRFDFVEMMPDPELVSDDVGGVDCRKLLEAMNERIRFLLDREHQIGHTYLMNVKSIDSLALTFKNKIVPLLQEYFYDNWEKIELVLNRNGFIDKRDVPEELLAEDQLIDVEKKVYEVLAADDDKWHEAESYQAIYRVEKANS